MLRASLTGMLVALTLSACQAPRLQEQTVGLASTLSDLQYEMILQNLAMLSAHGDLLPWHVKLDDGNVQVEYRARLNAELSPAASDLAPLLGGFGEYRPTLNWGVVPVVNPQELAQLQYLYRRALGLEVDEEKRPELDDEVPVDWFGVGSRADVPGDALVTGRWRERYAWVSEEGLRGLSLFTLMVLGVVELKEGERNYSTNLIASPPD